MPIKVNPDPHAQGFEPTTANSITAIVDDLQQLTSTIRELKQSGFPDESTSAFIGEDGLRKLDLSGEEHGRLAQILRGMESLAAEKKVNEDAEEALKTGRIFVVVLTDGSEDQKSTARRILMSNNAHNIRFVGQWAVEHL